MLCPLTKVDNGFMRFLFFFYLSYFFTSYRMKSSQSNLGSSFLELNMLEKTLVFISDLYQIMQTEDMPAKKVAG